MPGLVLAALIAATGCQGSPTGPAAPGSLRVSVSTIGGDLDLDGYTVQVDGGLTKAVGALAALTFADLTPGAHVVELSGVAENCSVRPATTQTVTVQSGETVRIEFAVECTATGLDVLVVTTGLDFGGGYVVLVDGVPLVTAFPNVTTRISRMSAGTHEVTVTEVPSNCGLTGPNHRTVEVGLAQIVPVSFSATCAARTGNIEVTTVTTGADLDPSGYVLQIDGLPDRIQPTNGKTFVAALPGGESRVRLADVGTNCAVVGENPRTVVVTVGGMTRDTARVTFEVSCVRYWNLAFVREGAITLLPTGGGEVERIGNGAEPAWSPDGWQLAYSCGGICITPLDGGATVQIAPVSYGYDVSPAWRPDGARIALSSYACSYYYYYYGYSCQWNGLFLIAPDGTNPSKLSLPTGVSAVWDVAWSPLGDRLAFTCSLASGTTDICLVKPDGTGFQQLTNDSAADGSPTWNPDGTRLAFHTDRYPVSEIVVLNLADGTVTRLAPEIWGRDPAWSPDGATIAFTGTQGLFVINADGSGLTRLTTAFDYQPAWRP